MSIEARIIFHQDLHGIIDEFACDRDPHVRTIADSVSKKISAGEIIIEPDFHGQIGEHYSGFRILTRMSDRLVIPQPVVYINPDEHYFRDNETRRADLIKTLAIAYQYPDNGFERQYAQIYREAAALQLKWVSLQANSKFRMPEKPFDEKHVLSRHIGGIRALTDVGFEDWNRISNNFIQETGFSYEDQSLLSSKTYFIGLREEYSRIIFEVLKSRFGSKKISEWNRDYRAAIVARLLFGFHLARY